MSYKDQKHEALCQNGHHMYIYITVKLVKYIVYFIYIWKYSLYMLF